ncbi:MAG: hypothetical protein ACK4QL_11415 [Pseudanabaenaceae cyanobacterium]
MQCSCDWQVGIPLKFVGGVGGLDNRTGVLDSGIYYQLMTWAEHPLSASLWLGGLIGVLLATVWVMYSIGTKQARQRRMCPTLFANPAIGVPLRNSPSLGSMLALLMRKGRVKKIDISHCGACHTVLPIALNSMPILTLRRRGRTSSPLAILLRQAFSLLCRDGKGDYERRNWNLGGMVMLWVWWKSACTLAVR